MTDLNFQRRFVPPPLPPGPRHLTIPPVNRPDGIPCFRVFVLGTKGSGKTVFLAALYKKLCVQDKRRNSFFLKCEKAEQCGQLLEKLDQMEHDEKWPPPSYTVDNFQFLCCHELRGEDLKLFRFEYADYPGGYITRPQPDFSVHEEASKSHSILVLLDGQKIFDLLDGKDRGLPSIYSELDKVVSVLVECIGRPVHFLITKSDIFDFSVHPLEEISEALFRHSNFRTIVERLCESGPVHLVPVSAVGATFAAYQGGRMKKRPGAMIEPLSVDLSIGFTLMDHIRQLKESQQHYGPIAKLLFVQKLRLMLARALGLRSVLENLDETGRLATFLLWLPINIHAVLRELEGLAIRADEKLENFAIELQATINGMCEAIHDRKTAVAAVVQIQAALVAAFERKFPASNLNARIGERSQ
jgi:hypothetical protein